MTNYWGSFMLTLAFLVIFAAMALFGCVVVRGFELITQDVSCVAYLGAKEIYNGPAYNINSKSNGSSVHVSINNGTWIVWPKKHYVASDIKIVCE
jgi:hypothetical protein